MSEDNCPFCGARAITISGYDFECGSSQYVNGINRSSICYEKQLSQQAQEIERLREVVVAWRCLCVSYELVFQPTGTMKSQGHIGDAIQKLKDLGEI